jgi:hypothetical protein
MTTFYSIHAYDKDSRYHAGEDMVDNGKLYTSFERACDEIEKRIRIHVESSEEFEPPDREELRRNVDTYIHWPYSPLGAGRLWVISKWEVDA